MTTEATSPHTADRIPLKADGRIVFVPLRSISWIESAGNYVEFVIGSRGQRVTVRETLAYFEEHLDAQRFVRIHRSLIVNVNRIREMRPRYTGEYQLTMVCGKQLTMSRGYRSNLQRLLLTSNAPLVPASQSKTLMTDAVYS